MLTINSFEIENVKKVRAVALAPSPNGLTVIGGRNCQGKTSILDAIAYALGGEKRRPSGFQNTDGLSDGRIQVTLSNGLVVTRSGKNAALKVTDSTGNKAGQKLLDSLVEELAIDLPKFMEADGRKKASILLHTLGIEDTLDALDKEERRLYDERTLQRREADRKSKYAAELPEYPDAPDSPLDASAIMEQLRAASLANQRADNHAASLARAREAAEYSRSMYERVRLELADAEARMKRADAELQELEQLHPARQDEAPLQAQLDGLVETNRRVQANLDKSAAKDAANEAAEAVNALTAGIEDVRKRRLDLLANVPMPLDGLTVTDGELVYNGQKWDCMSSMEQIRVAVAVCRSLKPDCGFVLLDQMEKFDMEQLEEFGQWLEAQGMQALATRVSTGDECTIIIEDGMVAAREEEPKAAAEKPLTAADLEAF